MHNVIYLCHLRKVALNVCNEGNYHIYITIIEETITMYVQSKDSSTHNYDHINAFISLSLQRIYQNVFAH